MDKNVLLNRATTMLLVGLAGLLGLIGVENARGVEFPEEMGLILPVMLSLASLPIVLLAIAPSTVSRWVALVIATLLALFHAMHILEHGMGGDWSVALLILVAMFTPSAAAVWLLWRTRTA